MKFRLIPPGKFNMGVTEEDVLKEQEIMQSYDKDERLRSFVKSASPSHPVTITKPFYVGTHLVTQANYETVIGTNPSSFARTGATKELAEKVAGLDTSDHPVETVSWYDAVQFCRKLSQRDQLEPFYDSDDAKKLVTVAGGTGYRLPTEAEWEFACRSGTTTKYWCGDKDEDTLRFGWLYANSGQRTHPVGRLPPNPFGLFDMFGNVYQLVHDRWEPDYFQKCAVNSAIDPFGAAETNIQVVFRGAHHSGGYAGCLSWWRGPSYFLHASHGQGFRAARSVDAVRREISTDQALDGPAFLQHPAYQQWMKQIVALPPDRQVDAVAKRLQELNRGFDGKVTHKIENFAVTELEFPTDNVTDISPVRALMELKKLKMNGSTYRSGKLTALSPLKGMSLEVLICSNTQVSDLSPLKDMISLVSVRKFIRREIV